MHLREFSSPPVPLAIPPTPLRRRENVSSEQIRLEARLEGIKTELREVESSLQASREDCKLLQAEIEHDDTKKAELPILERMRNSLRLNRETEMLEDARATLKELTEEVREEERAQTVLRMELAEGEAELRAFHSRPS